MKVSTKMAVQPSAWGAVRMFAASGLMAGAVLICGFIAIASPATTLIPVKIPVPSSYFNLNILFGSAAPVPWPQVPFHGWRAWHALWFDLEPQRRQWKFDHLDKLASDAQQHHSEMDLLLAYSPQWAAGSSDPKSDWKAGTTGPLLDLNDWRDYVRAVGTRYKGRIHTYEIWNEPDRVHAWLGDMDTMVQMVRDASSILKGIDPTITIVSPSPTTSNGVAWMRDFLSKGGGKYVDVIGYHFYVQKGNPEAMVPIIQKVRAVMEQNGVGDKPLWNTEAGWLDANFFSDDQQAAFVARSYIVNWAAGVSRYYWYAWDSHQGSQIELVKLGNVVLTPAGQAFVTIQEWMTGSVVKSCVVSEDYTWTCELQQNETARYLVWNTHGNLAFPIAQDWHVTQQARLDGTVRTINGGSVQIGGQPTLLE
jgi:hypothetical protein